MFNPPIHKATFANLFAIVLQPRCNQIKCEFGRRQTNQPTSCLKNARREKEEEAQEKEKGCFCCSPHKVVIPWAPISRSLHPFSPLVPSLSLLLRRIQSAQRAWRRQRNPFRCNKIFIAFPRQKWFPRPNSRRALSHSQFMNLGIKWIVICSGIRPSKSSGALTMTPPEELRRKSGPKPLAPISKRQQYNVSRLKNEIAFRGWSAISLIKGVCGQRHVLNKNAVALTARYVILLFIVHKMLFKFHLALKGSNFATAK